MSNFVEFVSPLVTERDNPASQAPDVPPAISSNLAYEGNHKNIFGQRCKVWGKASPVSFDKEVEVVFRDVFLETRTGEGSLSSFDATT
jgi:hypothetical protein